MEDPVQQGTILLTPNPEACCRQVQVDSGIEAPSHATSLQRAAHSQLSRTILIDDLACPLPPLPKADSRRLKNLRPAVWVGNDVLPQVPLTLPWAGPVLVISAFDLADGSFSFSRYYFVSNRTVVR